MVNCNNVKVYHTKYCTEEKGTNIKESFFLKDGKKDGEYIFILL